MKKHLKFAVLLLFSWVLLRAVFLWLKNNSSASQWAMMAAAFLAEGALSVAVPLFVFLLYRSFVEGALDKKQALVIFCAGVAFELPYDVLTAGKLFSSKSQNPLFALSVCALCLMLITHFKALRVKGALFTALIVVCSLFWVSAFSVKFGLLCVCLLGAKLFFGKRKMLSFFSELVILSVFSSLNPLYMLSPLSLIVVGFLEKGIQERDIIINSESK